MMFSNNDLKAINKFVAKNDVLIMAGTDGTGYEISLLQEMDLDEVATVISYMIKTIIGSSQELLDTNEQTELELLRRIEDKLVECELPYKDMNPPADREE